MSKMTSRLLASTAIAGGVVRADEDEKEERREDKRRDADEREDASAGTRESTEIMDAVSRCMDAVERMADAFGKRFDRQDARMDALEGGRKDAEEDEEEKREDKRKDAKDEDEREESREDKRKDASEEEEEKREDKRKDAARRDGEEDEKEERREDKRKDGEEERHADATAATLAEIQADVRRLTEENKRLTRLVPKPMTDADSGQLLQAQAHADEVYVELGKRAPTPLVNEDLATYRRRVAIDLQSFSPKLKDADLWAVADSASFDTLEKVIYADAIEAARNPVDPGPNRLRAVQRKSGGHEFTEYYGDSAGWMGDLAYTATRGVGSVTEMMKAGQGR